MYTPGQGDQAGGVLSNLTFLLHLDLQLIVLGLRTEDGPPALLSLPIKILISLRDILIDTTRIIFGQISRHLVVQSSCHIKLTTTETNCHYLMQEIRKAFRSWESPQTKF